MCLVTNERGTIQGCRLPDPPCWSAICSALWFSSPEQCTWTSTDGIFSLWLPPINNRRPVFHLGISLLQPLEYLCSRRVGHITHFYPWESSWIKTMALFQGLIRNFNLRSSMPCSAWLNDFAPIFNLLFIELLTMMTQWYGYNFLIAVSFVGIRLSYVSFPQTVPQTVPMMRCFDVSMKNLLNKQSIVRWFGIPWRSFDVSVIQRCYIYFIDLKSVQIILLSTKWIARTRNIPNL